MELANLFLNHGDNKKAIEYLSNREEKTDAILLLLKEAYLVNNDFE